MNEENNPIEKKNSTKVVHFSKSAKLALSQHRRIFSDIKHNLNFGDTVIGRKDSAQPSDIEVDDEYMSKRTVRISVNVENNAYTYKLSVLHATNPVKYNGKTLSDGETLYMKNGDSFTLGKTLFNVIKE